MKVIVIGGGAAGMVCSLLLSEKGVNVTLLEKNEKLGKKIYITGKGRCNLTNYCDPNDYLQNVVHGEKFMRSIIYGFTPENTIELFNRIGLPTVVERGNRVFPLSQKASDVTKVLQNALVKNNVEIKLHTKVENIKKQGDKFIVFTPWEKIDADVVVIATGGLSYPSTGSTGDGYKWAKNFGLKIVDQVPALSPILTKESVSELNGISLKNVTLTASLPNGKELISEFGELLFTRRGISGPCALTVSSYINRQNKVKLSIDLKPALNEEKLENRILRDFEERSNQDLKNVTRALLPEKLNMYVLNRAKLDPNKKVNQVSKEERQRLLETVKNLTFNVLSLAPFEECVVTSGGVDLLSLKPTMQAKEVENLYFIGEVCDIDALTGGYNLQVAFATANKASLDIIKKYEEEL